MMVVFLMNGSIEIDMKSFLSDATFSLQVYFISFLQCVQMNLTVRPLIPFL